MGALRRCLISSAATWLALLAACSPTSDGPVAGSSGSKTSSGGGEGASGSAATTGGGMASPAGTGGAGSAEVGGAIGAGGGGGAGGGSVAMGPACAMVTAMNTSGLVVKRPEIGARKLGNLAIADVIRID